MKLTNPANFFKVARRIMYPDGLQQQHVDGMNVLVSSWQGSDIRYLAYILATAKRECMFNLGIREVGRGSGKTYGRPDPETGETYYGRGPVQLTWKTNYEKMGKLLGRDLVHKPDDVLIPTIGVRVMFLGMEQGSFTGKKLSDYFDESREDAFNARKVVNGLDHAREIEVNYWLFKLALMEGTL